MARKKKNAAQQKHLVAQGELDVEMPVDEMVQKRQNKYLLINAIARRSRDLNRGSKVLVNLPHPHTWTELAEEEARQGLLKLERRAKGKVLVNLIDTE